MAVPKPSDRSPACSRGIRLALLLLMPLLQWACATTDPRATSLEPFDGTRTLDEYTRKSLLWQREVAGQRRAKFGDFNEISVSAAKRDSAGSITNNQVEGVDEGDIVKRIGDFVVLLRRGRLFSYSISPVESQPTAISYIDVLPTGEDMDAWYDEILVHGRTILLLGYSYETSTTLIRKFELSEAGQLSRSDSFYFVSEDYYDGENYGTRLVGSQLVFYFARALVPDAEQASKAIISGRIVDGKPVVDGPAFSREVVYQPVQHSDAPTLHTIARCPIDRPEFHCEATTILGPGADLMYVSRDAAYLWLNSSGWAYDYFLMGDRWVQRAARRYWRSGESADDLAVVYRVPLDGTRPGLVGVSGRPINQFSFNEAPNALQVIVRTTDEDPVSPAVWTIPTDMFGQKPAQLSLTHLSVLPTLTGDMHVNRFVGDLLLYDDTAEENGFLSTLMIKDLATTTPPVAEALTFAVERIEPVGKRAVVIGPDLQSGLVLVPFDLQNGVLRGAGMRLPLSVQADGRSHSFNYRSRSDGDLLGLPVIRVSADDMESGRAWWDGGPRDIHMEYLFIGSDLTIRPQGVLSSRDRRDDHCIVSCADWYGDSRPFFIGERLYALLGYELVQGHWTGGAIEEDGRADALDLLQGSQVDLRRDQGD